MNTARDDSFKIEKLRILYEKLGVLEEKLHLFVEPAEALTTIFNIEITKIQIENIDLSVLAPDEYLSALQRTEDWYTHRGYKYPHPDWLKTQREFWQAKLNHTN